MLHWSPTTLQQYDRVINKFRHYCENSELQFSLEDDALLVDYLCTIADSSNRPHSQLNIVLAAVKAYREALWLGSIRPQISKLVEGLVKPSTGQAMRKTSVMPVQPFFNLFESWPENEELDTRQLRLNTICLMALTFMLRPSDIAPRTKYFEVESGLTRPLVFGTDSVVFSPKGGMSITFHGIKMTMIETVLLYICPRQVRVRKNVTQQ